MLASKGGKCQRCVKSKQRCTWPDNLASETINSTVNGSGDGDKKRHADTQDPLTKGRPVAKQHRRVKK